MESKGGCLETLSGQANAQNPSSRKDWGQDMDIKRIAKETAKVLASYLTYQAVKTIMEQLRETNPSLAIWFNQFSTTANIQDGDAYLQRLLAVNPELAFRVMTVRQHLATEVAEYLPEMLLSNIQQSNMAHQRLHLERITQLGVPESDPCPEAQEAETDSESALDPE